MSNLSPALADHLQESPPICSHTAPLRQQSTTGRMTTSQPSPGLLGAIMVRHLIMQHGSQRYLWTAQQPTLLLLSQRPSLILEQQDIAWPSDTAQ